MKTKKYFNILIPKETRAGEMRCALIPKEVQALIKQGHHIFVEHDAGKGAGFSDQDYIDAGAVIRYIHNESLDSYKAYFNHINLVVRAKRPERPREILENSAMAPGTILVGALDPLEKNSSHIDEYHRAHIIAYSIDQLNLPSDDPMNLLAAMSHIAGRLALLDAIEKCHSKASQIVIIGFGAVGRAAFQEAMDRHLSTTVILTNPKEVKNIESRGAAALMLNKNDDLAHQQEVIKAALREADIVITSARKANQPAPLLIPIDTLAQMKKGSVIVDMALSEGGNVEGSEHDETHFLGNGVIVTNKSGYPKALPGESSKLWSKASFLFINKLSEGEIDHLLLPS